MRNPLNSWEKSDSHFWEITPVEVGDNDLTLMKKLCKAGTDHRKFMRMITVYVDVTAPLYWWKEYDTYKVGTVANSCSTMHKISEKEFTLDDFSREHLFTGDYQTYGIYDNDEQETIYWQASALEILNTTIQALNAYRKAYLGSQKTNKALWWQMIQLLPSSYNQKRTLMLNYEVLSNIYKSRKSHKLDEWCNFCKWIETLPYSELITGNTAIDN
nr:MAG TPA: hypothetical protein [Caudoviricetes sp.]